MCDFFRRPRIVLEHLGNVRQVRDLVHTGHQPLFIQIGGYVHDQGDGTRTNTNTGRASQRAGETMLRVGGAVRLVLQVETNCILQLLRDDRRINPRDGSGRRRGHDGGGEDMMEGRTRIFSPWMEIGRPATFPTSATLAEEIA